MTILIGSNNTTGFTSIARMAGLAGRANFQTYTCSASGNITTLGYYWGDSGVGSENLVLFLCNSSGTTLCNTGSLTTPSTTTQFVTGSVTSTAVTSGQTYYIGLLAAAGNNGGDDRIGAAYNGLSSYEDTTTVWTYPTPATTYSSIVVNGGLPNWLGYADGSPAGTSSTPPSGSVTATGNSATVTSRGNTIIAPITAERRIWTPSDRKIFLPSYIKRAA